MKKTLCVLAALLILAGCQHQESQQAPSQDQRKDLSHKLMLKGLSDLQNKDLKATITDLETAIKVDPSDPDAYLLLAQILLKVNEPEHAADFLENASKNFPDEGNIFYMLSVADRMAGRKAPAVLAARHSFEIFQAAQDRDNMLKSAALLHDLVDSMDAPAGQPAAAASKSVSPEQVQGGNND